MSIRFMGTRVGLPLPLREGRGEGASHCETQRQVPQHQTRLAAAHAAPPDVRSGHRALRSLDTGWRSAILAPLASDAGRAAWAAPRWLNRVDGARSSLPLLLGGGGGEGSFRGTIKSPKPLAAQPTRRAFTLVELLVVIGILGVLAALITPAVFQARVSARNAAIKAEIDMLHMAIMNYKNEYGSFPPCVSGTAIADPAARHIKRLFPRWPPVVLTNSTTQSNALVGWLSGYSLDPTNPIGTPREKLFDFDESRINSGEYFPSGKRGSVYYYTSSSQYFTDPPTNTTPRQYVEFSKVTSEDTNGDDLLTAGEDQNGNGRLDGEDVNQNGSLDPAEDVNSDGILNHGLPFNPSTFQIISAGLDETLGTGDDLSNFWKGTRQDYLDSLE